MRHPTTSTFVSPERREAYLAHYAHMLHEWPPYERVTITGRYGRTGVLLSGAVSSPPLVLLHGRYTPSPSWTPLIHELAKRYRVHAIDTIGEPGLSVNDAARLHSADDYTQWLTSTLDGMGLGATHVCGHSFGGWIATRFAIAHPSRVRSLTLLDPAQVFAPFARRWMLHCIRPYLFPTRRNIDRLFRWTGQGRRRHADLVELATQGMLSFRVKAPEASLVPDAQLRLLTMPAQQLIATDSVVHDPDKAHRRAARIHPAVRTVLVPDSSHFIAHDQPTRVLRTLHALTDDR